MMFLCKHRSPLFPIREAHLHKNEKKIPLFRIRQKCLGQMRSEVTESEESNEADEGCYDINMTQPYSHRMLEDDSSEDSSYSERMLEDDSSEDSPHSERMIEDNASEDSNNDTDSSFASESTSVESPYASSCGKSNVEEYRKCCKHVKDQLITHGIESYLLSSYGGEATEKVAKTLIIRVTDMLIWTYEQHHKASWDGTNALLWFKAFIVNHYILIGQYVEHLTVSKNRTAATILHILNDVKKAVIWIVVYSSPKNYNCNLHIQHDQMESLFHLISVFSRNLNRKIKKDRCGSNRNTFAGIVFARQLPVNGMKGLVETWRNQEPWIKTFVSKVQNEKWSYIDKEDYEMFLQILFAGLYVFAPQGRAGGIAELRCQQASEMLSRGFTQTNKFKTNSVYGYQPVLTTKETRKILHNYVYCIRPKICGSPTNSLPDSPLWLLYNGCGVKGSDVSSRVRRFFLRTMQLNVTTTNIRKLVEIQCEKAKREAIISETEREAVKNINGHSSQTVKDYYLLLDRNEDAKNGTKAFRKIFDSEGLQDDKCDNNTFDDEAGGENMPISDCLSHAPWGTAHPSFNKSTLMNKRVKWSNNEVNYIRNWISMQPNPNESNRVSKCLRHIKNDPKAMPLFHMNHILNSGGLRSGFDRAFESETTTCC